MTRPYSAADEQKLMTELWDPRLAEDLYKFVMYVYPWGKPGTPLEKEKGPRTWQKELLDEITQHIKENKVLIYNGKDPKVFQSAVASGRGIGKSSFNAWIIHWMLSTQLGSTTIVTANTEDQLKSKTWGEVGKWLTLAINGHWFEKTALSVIPQEWFKDALQKQLKIDSTYYYARAQLWSEENPDAFAGAHNMAGMNLIFDEASGIPPKIWTVSEGFFTEPILHRYWSVFSNPRRNTGQFFECFHKFRNYWRRRNIDSRTVEGTDKALLNKIVEQYGEDSDEARVEVKGQFPRQGDRQFISREVVENAVKREVARDDHAALIMGVDPARYGDDSTVIRFRQGRNARIIKPIILKHADNMAVANTCADLIQRYNPDAVCIDAGNGTGIIDRLREMRFKVHEVWFGAKAEKEEWANKRTELWADMKSWLGGACIDNLQELLDDLTGPQYKFMGSSDKIMLETKEDMKKRGHASPDHADALACTFAVKIARRDLKTSNFAGKGRIAKGMDYKIFGD